jgi:uncharacterized membrane protein YhhN
MNLKKFDYIFIFILTIDLIGIYCAPSLRMIFKPLIVTSLIVYYVRYMGSDQRIMVLAALLFGLLGDIFLLFDSSQTFFLVGLIAFLIMQLLYAVFFKKYYQPPRHNNKNITYGLLLIGIIFNVVFFEKLGDMKWAVIVYTFAIMTMAYFGINQVLSQNIKTGALFFVASDFILAINKFIYPSPILPYAVMITYAIAQYFIVMGVSEEADVLANIRKKNVGKK